MIENLDKKLDMIERLEKVTLTVYLRDHEITALQRSVEEMNQWKSKTEGAVKGEYDLINAIRWALSDGIKKLIKDQLIDDSISR